MTDLFSNGFSWTEEEVSHHDATPAATLPEASRPAFYGEFLADPWPREATVAPVAPVAPVAKGEGAALARRLSQPASLISATPSATPESADFCGPQTDFLAAVAGVASVAAWRAGVAHLSSLRDMPAPHPATSWRQLIADARAFVETWGDDAVAAGWSTLDVFGTNPFVRQRRFDRAGLVVLLDGAPIQTLDSGMALIGEGRDCQTYRRGPRGAGSVPLWAVRDEGWK